MAKRKNKLAEPTIFWLGVIVGAVGFFVLAKIPTNHIENITEGKQFSKAGYLITWSNPRYEFDKEILSDSFKVDVLLKNESVKPSLMPVFNCDIVDGGKTVLAGSGVLLDESHELFVGESHDYVVTVPLEVDYTKKSQIYTKDDGNAFPNRRVSACSFTPTGSYDPNISVKIVF